MKRILDAWRVLRGSHTAWAKVDPPTVPDPPAVWLAAPNTTTAAVSNFWVEPRTGSVDR